MSEGGDEPSDQEEEEVSGSSDEGEEVEEESDVGGSDEDSDSGPDLARGKGNVETSSEDEEDGVDDVLRREEEEIEHAWGDLCKDAPRTDEVRRRGDVPLSPPRDASERLLASAGFCSTGALQHGLGPAEGQRPAGPAQVLRPYRGRCAVCEGTAALVEGLLAAPCLFFWSPP